MLIGKKCLLNKDKVSICLNHLNFLLGKNEKEIRSCIDTLFKEYPKAFSVLNLLIAVRSKDNMELVLDVNHSFVVLESYFENPSKIYDFIQQTGLMDIFSNKKIKDLNDHQAFGDDIKKFDFVLYTKNKTYFIECNFYSSAGSKLNEVARAYQDLAPKFDIFKNYDFVWITDGQGWLEAKKKLVEAYKKVEIYNLSNINNFIQKALNDCF